MTLLAAGDLFGIAGDLWASYVADEPLPGIPGLLTPDLSARVSICGGWSGVVLVATTERGARLVAATLLQLPEGELTAADVDDALGELANIVGGNVKSVLPGPSALSLPTVSPGPVAVDPGVLESETALEWCGENFEISVWASPEGEGT